MANRRRILKITAGVIGGFLLLLLLLAGVIIYKWETNTTPCVPDIPERIGQVHETAKWIGGCDGGHWFDVVEVDAKNNRYLIGIYFDYNGKLIAQKYFSLKAECPKPYQDKEAVYSAILYYDFFEITTKGTDCNLLPVDNTTE